MKEIKNDSGPAGTEETREEKRIRMEAKKAELREERKALARWNKNMKRLRKMGAVVILALAMSFANKAMAQDTIYVKKVFVNGRSIKVRKGYIIKMDSTHFLVNKKRLKLIEYKETEDPKYKSHRTGTF